MMHRNFTPRWKIFVGRRVQREQYDGGGRAFIWYVIYILRITLDSNDEDDDDYDDWCVICQNRHTKSHAHL